MASQHDNCPNCGVSFLGGPIPKESLEFYGGATHWRREIGIDGGYMGIYDGIVAWQCPDCKHEFPRGDSSWALELFAKYKQPELRDPNNDPFQIGDIMELIDKEQEDA